MHVAGDNGAGGNVWNTLISSIGTENFSFSTMFAFALLVLPTIWLTKFNATKHHRLFLLKEDYQYKYSLAMAVDGFKKQAPEHADAIAAETFNRLLFNPTNRLAGKFEADAHPSPLMNWLMNRLGFNAEGNNAGEKKKV